MSPDYVDDCAACGRPVKEHHSFVMVMPIGRGRRFYHLYCGRKASVSVDAARDRHPSSKAGLVSKRQEP